MLRDPGLTEIGVAQAEFAAKNDALRDVELVLVSPLRRTLETACVAFKGVPIVAVPDLQETNALPCDTGRPFAQVQADFPEVDLTLLRPCPNDWFEKIGLMESHKVTEIGLQLLRERLDRVARFVLSRHEHRIAIVAHHMLFCHLVAADFANCEVMEMRLSADGEWTPPQDVVPLFKSDGTPLTRCGSPPLHGTVNTLRQNGSSESAVRLTCSRNGLTYRPPMSFTSY